VNWSVSFQPLIPWVWIAAGLVPLLVLACIGLYLRRRGAWLRLLAFLALALALAIPATVAERDAIILTAFAVVAFSILIQGLTMPLLINRLQLAGKQPEEAVAAPRGRS